SAAEISALHRNVSFPSGRRPDFMQVWLLEWRIDERANRKNLVANATPGRRTASSNTLFDVSVFSLKRRWNSNAVRIFHLRNVVRAKKNAAPETGAAEEERWSGRAAAPG